MTSPTTRPVRSWPSGMMSYQSPPMTWPAAGRHRPATSSPEGIGGSAASRPRCSASAIDRCRMSVSALTIVAPAWAPSRAAVAMSRRLNAGAPGSRANASIPTTVSRAVSGTARNELQLDTTSRPSGRSRSRVGPSGSAKVTGPSVPMQRAYGELGANAMTWPGGKASRETRWPARAKVVPSLRVTTSPPVDWPTGSPPLSRCSSTNTPAPSAKAGTMAASVSPVISVRSRRAFLGRAVRYLAREAGIRQFIDIGSGIPTEQNVHEVAQAAASGSRIVYVDNDEVAVAHSRLMLEDNPDATVIQADLREPDKILADPETQLLIDFTQPVALLLLAVLHFVPDAANPAQILATLRDAVSPGSYLVICHACRDVRPET